MQKRTNKVVSSLLVVVLLMSLTGCAQKTEAVFGGQAQTYLVELDQMGSRIAGTDQELKAAGWIQTKLESMGYAVTQMPFTYDDYGTKNSQNIIAEKKGEGKGTLIVGAHYDSVDAANGVDDNGSGIVVILEAAKALIETKTPHTIKFVFFGAEEVDILGSAYYVEQMTEAEKADTILMVNFDSLVAGDLAYVYGDADEKGKFRDFVLSSAKAKNLPLITQAGENVAYEAGTTGDWSDHAPFKDAGIPFVYFESTNWSLGEGDGYTQVALQYGDNGEIWHTAYDNYAYIDKNFPGRIQERLALFSQVLQELITQDLSLVN